MNTEFATNVHTFTGSIVDLLFEQFEGKVLGGDGDDVLTKEEIMKSLFGDYKPDDSVELAVPKKGKKKKSSGSKKPRPLSGYTFFGKMSKEEINQEMAEVEQETGEKPKYVSLVGKKWKALSEEEHEEWNHAAKGYQLFIKEDSDNGVVAWKELSGPEKKEWNKKALGTDEEEVEETPKKSKKTKKVSKKTDGSDDEEA
jgi:hypothetical protein